MLVFHDQKVLQKFYSVALFIVMVDSLIKWLKKRVRGSCVEVFLSDSMLPKIFNS